jgi:RNA polymerase sigma factor (sigma-70 family)
MCSGIQNLKTPWAFSIWLNKIIINETNRYYVKNSRSGIVVNLEDYSETLLEEDNDYLPQDYLTRTDIFDKVKCIIKKLPDSKKQVLMFYYYDGLSVTEIAEAMGISKPTVSVALKRARYNIKKEIESMPGMAGDVVDSMSMIPTGTLLTRILRDEAVTSNIAHDVFIHKVVESCRILLQQGPSIGKVAPVVMKKVIVLSASVVAAVTILISMPADVPQEPEVLAIPEPVQVVIDNSEGQVIFESEDPAGNHVNPKSATVWTNSNYGALTVLRWEISDFDSGVVIYSGNGDIVDGILSDMHSRSENGVYMLRFFAEDGIGGNYTIGCSFIISNR